MRFLSLLMPVALCFAVASAHAAVTCTLDHPDRDIKRLFPESTGYRVRELIPFRHGKKDLLATLARELNDELDSEFETKDTPYTFYAVYKSTEHIAIVLGTNSRAVAGPMQLFVAYERKGNIKDIFVQKISSKDAPAFRSKFYRGQYLRYGVNNIPGEADVKPPIRSPSNDTIKDHHAFLRALRLNVLLMKHFYNQFRE